MVDYHTRDAGLDDALNSSPQAHRILPPMDGGSDTDFAVAPESGPDEDSDLPRPAEVMAELNETNNVKQGTRKKRVNIVPSSPPKTPPFQQPSPASKAACP
jgi:hypothetical protein